MPLNADLGIQVCAATYQGCAAKNAYATLQETELFRSQKRACFTFCTQECHVSQGRHTHAPIVQKRQAPTFPLYPYGTAARNTRLRARYSAFRVWREVPGRAFSSQPSIRTILVRPHPHGRRYICHENPSHHETHENKLASVPSSRIQRPRGFLCSRRCLNTPCHPPSPSQTSQGPVPPTPRRPQLSPVMFTRLLATVTLAAAANAYWTFGATALIAQTRLDPIVNPGVVRPIPLDDDALILIQGDAGRNTCPRHRRRKRLQ